MAVKRLLLQASRTRGAAAASPPPPPPFILEYIFTEGAASPYDIYYNKIDAAAAVKVDESESRSAAAPPSQSIARMSDGTIYVVYYKKLAGVYQIYVTYSADEGETWSDGLRISTYAGMAAQVQNISAIAVDSGDNLHVVWQGRATGYAKSQIWYAKYDGSWGSPIHVDPRAEAADYVQDSPSIAVDSEDNLHLVWHEHDTVDWIDRIYYTKYDGSWATPVPISTDVQGQYTPVIAVDSGDNLYVVWYGYPESWIAQIYCVKYDGSWGAPVRISTALNMEDHEQSLSGIAIDSSDNPHVVWQGMGGDHTTNDQVWYTKYDGSWATPICISTAASMDDYGQISAGIAVDEVDDIHMIWQGRTTDYANDVIWYAKFVASWEAPEVIEIFIISRFSNIRWSSWPR